MSIIIFIPSPQGHTSSSADWSLDVCTLVVGHLVDHHRELGFVASSSPGPQSPSGRRPRPPSRNVCNNMSVQILNRQLLSAVKYVI